MTTPFVPETVTEAALYASNQRLRGDVERLERQVLDLNANSVTMALNWWMEDRFAPSTIDPAARALYLAMAIAHPECAEVKEKCACDVPEKCEQCISEADRDAILADWKVELAELLEARA